MTTPTTKLVPIDAQQAARVEPDDDPEAPQLGRWFWTNTRIDHDKWNEDGTREHHIEKRLTCVVHVGSNYAEVKWVEPDSSYADEGGSQRISFDEWSNCCAREEHPEFHIRGKIEYHQTEVRNLLDKVRQVTAALGVVPREELPEGSFDAGQSALAVAHGTADVKKHKKALIKAKEKTLPELFKRIENQHKKLAMWMKADLIPAKAQLAKLKTSIGAINDRIFTVELYAGLVEELVLVRDGQPAANDAKVKIFQRQHFMDEECLYAYEAGGMEFKHIKKFDRWLARPENFTRILSHDRCVVSFRVRRNEKERDFESFREFINFAFSGLKEADKLTFLYIRNGEKLYRLITGIDFGEELFPDRDRSTLFNNSGDLWLKLGGDLDDVLSQQQYDDYCDERAKAAAKHEVELAAWHVNKAAWDKLTDEEREAEQDKAGGVRWPGFEPRDHMEGWARYEKLTPDHVYYDDAMRMIQEAATNHNRVAVVLQGLLDRSPAFHPHPPWRLWTPEGFTAGVELVYDSSHALSTGDAPDFEEYRARLNQNLKAGDITVGQEIAWEILEAIKYNNSARRSRYGRDHWEVKRHRPSGNPGPGRFAKVVKLDRKGRCLYQWMRTYLRDDSWHRSDKPLATEVAIPTKALLNVSAYTPGDFKLFYADPRTRANYIQWAPYLLAAEDYYGKLGRPVPNIFDNDTEHDEDSSDETASGDDEDEEDDDDDDDDEASRDEEE